MRRIQALALAVLLSLVVSACSADVTTSSPATDAGPFDAVLIELFGTSDTEAYLISLERHAAELVVVCMEEAGFEFQIPPEVESYEAPAAMDLAAAQADGFGIISRFRLQISQSDPAGRSQDPNQLYLSTLTSAEIERFVFTLDGVDPEPGQRKEDGGCNGEASDQAYADWLRFFEALPNYTVLGEERDTHPDWVAARATWQACMLDRGFDYQEPDAIRTAVFARMRDSVNEQYPGGQLPLAEQDGVFSIDPSVDELLNELMQFERDAAVANIECTQPIEDQLQAVEREVQQQFVDRNRATIDELLAAAK